MLSLYSHLLSLAANLVSKIPVQPPPKATAHGMQDLTAQLSIPQPS